MCFRKKAILMIHGFIGGSYDFNNFHNELELYRKFDVFTFTLPAHDKLIVRDVKYNDWINESKRQIEILINHGYKEIYLIGHSMGGVIAAYLASIYPQVKKLVLAAPAFRYFYFKDGKIDIKNINQSIKNIPEIFRGHNTEQVISRILKTPITTIVEFIKLVDKYQDCVNNISCPTLTIHGLDDLIVPKEATQYVYDSIKSKTNILINVKNLNHDCFKLKSSDLVKEQIKIFLIKKPKKKKEIINI